jgi:hypothetical protein
MVDAAGSAKYLKVRAESTGAFTVLNHRNKFSKTCPAK